MENGVECSMVLQIILVAISYLSRGILSYLFNVQCFYRQYLWPFPTFLIFFSFFRKILQNSKYPVKLFYHDIWPVHEFYHRNFLLSAWCMFVVNSQDPSQTCFLFIKLSWVFLRYHQHIIFSLLIKKTHPLSFNLQSPEGIIKKLSP